MSDTNEKRAVSIDPFWNVMSKVEVLSIDLYDGHLLQPGEVEEDDEEEGPGDMPDEQGPEDEAIVEGAQGVNEPVEEVVFEEPDEQIDEEAALMDEGANLETESEADIEEIEEAWLTSFEPPEVAPKRLYDNAQLHACIAARTIVAAAKGGHLRQLDFFGEQPYAFAVRSVVPYWVNLESLETETRLHGWMQAASLLRPFLAHSSLWLNTAQNADPRHSRHLTAQEVQALLAYAQQEGLPKLRSYQDEAEKSGLSDGREEPLECYLAWLEEDHGLAQKVAETWSAVIERGEANKVMCRCKRCTEIALVSWLV